MVGSSNPPGGVGGGIPLQGLLAHDPQVAAIVQERTCHSHPGTGEPACVPRAPGLAHAACARLLRSVPSSASAGYSYSYFYTATDRRSSFAALAFCAPGMRSFVTVLRPCSRGIRVPQPQQPVPVHDHKRPRSPRRLLRQCGHEPLPGGAILFDCRPQYGRRGAEREPAAHMGRAGRRRGDGRTAALVLITQVDDRRCIDPP